MLINHRLYRRTEYKIGHRGQSRTAASWFQARDATVTSLGDKLGRGTWNRTKIIEFKARCDKPLHYTPTKTWRCVGESNSRLRIDNPR